MKLIDKYTLVAEIKKRINFNKTLNSHSRLDECKAILSFIDTLEVKEVYLDKLLTGFMGRYAYENGGEYPSAIDIAKHFFELGLKAQKEK